MADLATRADIARLFGRAAFGATGADHDTWQGKPYADVVLTQWLNDPTGPRPDEGDPAFRLSGTDLESDGSLAGLFTGA